MRLKCWISRKKIQSTPLLLVTSGHGGSQNVFAATNQQWEH